MSTTREHDAQAMNSAEAKPESEPTLSPPDQHAFDLLTFASALEALIAGSRATFQDFLDYAKVVKTLRDVSREESPHYSDWIDRDLDAAAAGDELFERLSTRPAPKRGRTRARKS